MKFKNIFFLYSTILFTTASSNNFMNRQDNLSIAVRNRNMRKVEQIFRKSSGNIRINKKYGRKVQTLLHYAAISHAHEIAKILIQNGAHLNIKNLKKRTPMWYAFNNNDLEMIWILVEAGANVNEQYWFGQTLLHIACREGDYKLAKLLIESGANINAKDEFEDTPLNEAMRKGNRIIATLLLNREAQIDQPVIINLGSLEEETEEDSTAGEDTEEWATEVELDYETETESNEAEEIIQRLLEGRYQGEIERAIIESIEEQESTIGQLSEEEQKNAHYGYVGNTFSIPFKCCICQEDLIGRYVQCNRCMEGIICYECFTEKDFLKKLRWNETRQTTEYLLKCPSCRNPYVISYLELQSNII